MNIKELGVPPSRGRGRGGHSGQRDLGHEPEGWRAEGTGEGTEPRSQGWHSGEKVSERKPTQDTCFNRGLQLFCLEQTGDGVGVGLGGRKRGMN